MEVAKGDYPTGEDINKEFRISIWTYTKLNALYKKAGFKPYHERTIRFKTPSVSNDVREIQR